MRGAQLLAVLAAVSSGLLVGCGDDTTAQGTGGQGAHAGAGGSVGGGGGSVGGGGSSAGGGGAGGSVVEPALDPCTTGEAGTVAAHFVAATGSGTSGASWADAWPDLDSIDWGVVSAGTTLCIAGGSYGSLSVQTGGTADARVCIRRATADDPLCGLINASWNPAFDAQVVVSDISCPAGSCSYVTVDGQVPYVGIKVDDQTTGEDYAVNLNQSGADGFHLYNVDIAGTATLSTDFTGDGRALSALSGSPTTDLQVAYCQLHGKPTLVLTAGQHQMVVEHNRFYDNVVGNPAAWHPNVWVSVSDDVDVLWRYNEVRNWMVEGIMMCPNGTGCTPASGWTIYGNVWHDEEAGASGRVLEAQYETAGPIFLYDNTFANLTMVMGSQGNGGAVSGGVSQNNLMWNAPSNFDTWNIASTADLDANADPFADSANADFHLASGSAAIDVGVAIPPAGPVSFDRDMDGNTRGADGAWDVGAYERP